MEEKILQHKQKLFNLIAEAENLNIPDNYLYRYRDVFIEQYKNVINIQNYCQYPELVCEVQNIGITKVRIFKCRFCGKIIEIETLSNRDIKQNVWPPEIKIIFQVVSKEFDIPIDQILSKSQKNKYVRPRQLIIYFIQYYQDIWNKKNGYNIKNGCKKIANLFNCHHANILLSIEKIQNDIEVIPAYKKQYQNIKEKIDLEIQKNK